jgi:hypothetical protein
MPFADGCEESAVGFIKRRPDSSGTPFSSTTSIFVIPSPAAHSFRADDSEESAVALESCRLQKALREHSRSAFFYSTFNMCLGSTAMSATFRWGDLTHAS